MNARITDEVRVRQREPRVKYTKLEERKMWYFFARELRAGNEDALKKRQILWKIYEQEEGVSRKMKGLDSHFRKYMVKYIHMSSMSKEDMFLCLRFFEIGLNPMQHRFLEERYGCEIECTFDGTFRRASFLYGDDRFTLPTEEELATILGDDTRDDNLTEEEINPTDERELDNFNYGNEQNVSLNDNRQNRTETPIITANRDQDNVSRISNEIINMPPAEDEHNQIPLNKRADAEMINIEPATANSIDIGSEMDSSVMQHQNEKNMQIEVQMNSTNQMSQQQENQISSARKAFINGALKVFDGNMSTRAFFDPFLYIHGGIYANYARGINWLAGDEDDEEYAN